MADESISANITINTTAEAIFAVIVDPTKHAAIDGTGWVRDPQGREILASSGQIFRMAMYHPNHPDGDYQMANRIEVFDAPYAISWKPGYGPDDDNLSFGGWIWRYDLTPRAFRDRSQTLIRLVGRTRGGEEPTGPVASLLPRSLGQLVDAPRRTRPSLSAILLIGSDATSSGTSAEIDSGAFSGRGVGRNSIPSGHSMRPEGGTSQPHTTWSQCRTEGVWIGREEKPASKRGGTG